MENNIDFIGYFRKAGTVIKTVSMIRSCDTLKKVGKRPTFARKYIDI